MFIIYFLFKFECNPLGLFFLLYIFSFCFSSFHKFIKKMRPNSNTAKSTRAQIDTKRELISIRSLAKIRQREQSNLQDYLDGFKTMSAKGQQECKHKYCKTQVINQNILTTQTQNQQYKDRNIFWNIQVMMKVAHFIQNIKRRVVQSKKNLDPLQLFYLQNQSGEGQAEQQNVIAWDNVFLLIFQGVFLVFLLIGVWFCNYQAIFEKTSVGVSVYSIILAVYALSVVITLNTENKTIKLEVISKRSKIFYNYYKNQLLYEAIAIISLLAIVVEIPYLYYPSRILFTTSVKTIQRISTKIQDKYAASNSMEAWISIIKFLFKIITFLHFLSIVFNALHLVQKQAGTTYTWVQKHQLQDQSSFALYINGYYWAATIISTVGFGDFTPGNTFQRGIISFVMIFCCLFFGYCLNVIGNLIGALGQSTAVYQKDIRKLNRYLKTLKIPNDLQDKIKQHFYNRYQIQQVYDQQTQTYLHNKLTNQLQNSISQNSNIQILRKSTQMNFLTKKSKQLLTVAMKKHVYAPGEVIFDEHSEEVKLLLVAQGQIGQYCFDRVNSTRLKAKKPIAKYNSADNTIGWTNFVTGNKYRSSAKAENYSLVYQISQEEFLDIVRKNTSDLMKFTQIRQKYLQRKNKFKKECLVCNKFNHNVIDCPKIHFTPRPIQLMSSEIKNQISKRMNKRNVTICRRDKRLVHGLFFEEAQNSDQLFVIGEQQNKLISQEQIVTGSKINSQKQFDNQKNCRDKRQSNSNQQQLLQLMQFNTNNLKAKAHQKLSVDKSFSFLKEAFRKISVQKNGKKPRKQSIKQQLKILVENSALINRMSVDLNQRNSSFLKPIEFKRNSSAFLARNSQKDSQIYNKKTSFIEQYHDGKFQDSQFNFDAVMLQGNWNFFPDYAISKIIKQVNEKPEKRIELIATKLQSTPAFPRSMKRMIY